MPWKSITTFVTDLALDGPTLDAAAALASRLDAHLDVVCLGIDPTQADAYYGGGYAITLPDMLREATEHATALEAAVRQRLDDGALRWTSSSVAVPLLGLTLAVGEAARFSDLVIAARPYGPNRGPVDVQLVEAALFAAETAVLILPEAATAAGATPDFRRVAVAWNDSPEALRSTRAALPLLAQAEHTEILVVDPPRHGPDRSDPGGQVARMLSRHGVSADIRILARTLPTVAAVLSRQIEENGLDLLVMGAYGHSRLRESILGGATRQMLETSRVPMLMMH